MVSWMQPNFLTCGILNLLRRLNPPNKFLGLRSLLDFLERVQVLGQGPNACDPVTNNQRSYLALIQMKMVTLLNVSH